MKLLVSEYNNLITQITRLTVTLTHEKMMQLNNCSVLMGPFYYTLYGYLCVRYDTNSKICVCVLCVCVLAFMISPKGHPYLCVLKVT